MRPFLPDDIFKKRQADCLRDAAFNLSRRQHRIDYPADFLHRDKVIDVRFIGQRVKRNFSNINRPGKSAVRIALIFLIVPVNIRRRLVLC